MCVPNHTCSSNINQQPLINYPYFTNSNGQQQMNFSNNQMNHQMTSSNMSYPTTANMLQQQPSYINPQQIYRPQMQNVVMPMESENDDRFTLVKNNKKKKVKMNHVQHQTPVSCSSSFTPTNSNSTDNSTSSTNTSSMLSNVAPSNNNYVQTNPHTCKVPNIRYTTNEISQQARRYAETRFPFPPFVINFPQDVDEKSIIQNISSHFSSNYNFDLNFAGHRLKGKRSLLLFIKNRESFAILFDDDKWPQTINSMNYVKTRPNHLPSQFSIILKNVPVENDINKLLEDIKNDYPDVVHAIRISNKNKSPTTIVLLDIKNVKTIGELLNKK